uniref:Uncharacterized protein n=1 Tax=Xiphophorus couchianus TaxID=32473 RepID=A0A3B5LRV8_9TELE
MASCQPSAPCHRCLLPGREKLGDIHRERSVSWIDGVMRSFSPLLLLLALLRPFAACGTDFVQVSIDMKCRCDSSTAGTIYQYNARTLNGSRAVNFGDFAGKTVLFVNVATY